MIQRKNSSKTLKKINRVIFSSSFLKGKKTRLKRNMKRSKSSFLWLKRNFRDKYNQEKIKKKLPSRSWFKLREIQQNERILSKGMNVVELGSSPGGWSKYTADTVGPSGSVIACDILPMNKIKGVNFLQGNLYDSENMKILLEKSKKKKYKSFSPICPLTLLETQK